MTCTLIEGRALFARSAAQEPAPTAGFHPDPERPFERVHAALFRRTGPDGRGHGLDALDP